MKTLIASCLLPAGSRLCWTGLRRHRCLHLRERRPGADRFATGLRAALPQVPEPGTSRDSNAGLAKDLTQDKTYQMVREAGRSRKWWTTWVARHGNFIL